MARIDRDKECPVETVNAKTAIALLCLGFILIAVSILLLLGKIKMNYLYSFRIRNAFESEENWYRINRYGAKALMVWSVVLMVVGIACLYIEPQSVLTVAKVSFVSLLVPAVQTLYYARRLLGASKRQLVTPDLGSSSSVR
jgi:hypothetical protein